MENRNLREEFEKLNIISFDCNDIATKDDVFSALDAIQNHLNQNSDTDKLSHIEKLLSEKKARFFIGFDK